MKKNKGYRRIRRLKLIRLGTEGLAFLLLIGTMVLLVSIYKRLPEKFPLGFDANGTAVWGSPIHFIIVFGAGMLLYGGLSVLSRFKNIFGFALFAAEHKSRTKYEATLLLFSLLKVFSLAIFASVMCNMYVRARHVASMPLLDWIIFTVIVFIVVTIAAYFLAMAGLNRRKKRELAGGERA